MFLTFVSGLTTATLDALTDAKKHTWLWMVTALTKYLTAEYAMAATRAALELIGGDAYTNDYPLVRLYRDAQVLTVWKGPANNQAVEMLSC